MTSLVFVEDHQALREGLGLLLEREGVDIVGSAGDAGEGERLVWEHDPDVVLIDIRLEDGSGTGIDLATRLLRSDPERAIVFYTGERDPELFQSGLQTGARGYALKGGSATDLMEAIRTVAAGGTYFDPKLGPMLQAREPAETPAVRLSPREREIMGLLALGLTGEEIAQRLTVSPETVRTHVRNAMDKLGARTRAHAIAIAVQRGEVSLGDAA